MIKLFEHRVLKEKVSSNEEFLIDMIYDNFKNYIADEINEIEGIIVNNLDDPYGNEFYENSLDRYRTMLDDINIHVNYILNDVKSRLEDDGLDIDTISNEYLQDWMEDELNDILGSYIDFIKDNKLPKSLIK